MIARLLFIALLFNIINGWGITDWWDDVTETVDGWTDTVDDWTDTVVDEVTEGWNALSTAITDAADETTQFFITLSEVPEITEIISSIHKVITLVIDDIAEAIDDFEETTWKKLVKDAKYVIYNLPSQIQKYIAIGIYTFIYSILTQLI